MSLLSLTFGQCCYSGCQVINAVIFRVRWSLLLPSLSGGQCHYSPWHFVSSYSACQVVNAVILYVSCSLLLLSLPGSQCCHSDCQLANAVTIPLCWYKLLHCLFPGVSCCSPCQVDICTVYVCWSNCYCSCRLSMLSSPCQAVFVVYVMLSLSCSFLPCRLCCRSSCQPFRWWYLLLLILRDSLRPFSMGQLSMLLFSPHGVLCFYWLL